MGNRYPLANWAPWKYLSPSGQATYFQGQNHPEAVVLHIMAGWAHTAVEWAAAGHYGASWTYTVARDGTVFQHLDHEDGGYQAGIPLDYPKPRWKGYRPGPNINCYTIGIEHEGFPGEPFTPEQAESSRTLCKWLAKEFGFPYDRDHFPPHADIDLINRPNDFNTPPLREEHYRFMFEEDEMTPELRAELDAMRDMIKDTALALMAGGEEPGSREERYQAAAYRIKERSEARAESVLSYMGSHVADKAAHR